MKVSPVKIVILVVALYNAYAHTTFAGFSDPIGLYFSITTVLFAAGAFAVLTSGKLFKPAVIGLFVLSLIDNVLILITATIPTPLSGGQVFGFSTDLFPPGSVEVFIAQVIIMALTAYTLLQKRKAA